MVACQCWCSRLIWILCGCVARLWPGGPGADGCQSVLMLQIALSPLWLCCQLWPGGPGADSLPVSVCWCSRLIWVLCVCVARLWPGGPGGDSCWSMFADDVQVRGTLLHQHHTTVSICGVLSCNNDSNWMDWHFYPSCFKSVQSTTGQEASEPAASGQCLMNRCAHFHPTTYS